MHKADAAEARAREATPLVLIVEDYADTQAMYGFRLRREGFDVAFADDGDAAVEMARALRPAVIVMDLALRSRDGWSATRELRSDPTMAETPILAVSGHVTPECIRAAYEAGCSRFLPKPCLPDTLVEHIRDFLPPPPRRRTTDHRAPLIVRGEAIEAIARS